MLAKHGIWTPHALIICYECHGPVFPRRTFKEDEFKAHCAEMPIDEDNAVTTCDKCDTYVQVSKHLATEHNLMCRLRQLGVETEMVQTGGMCSAVEIKTLYKDYYWCTFDWEGDGKYFIQRIDGETGDSMNESAEVDTYDEAIQYIMLIGDLLHNDPEINDESGHPL